MSKITKGSVIFFSPVGMCLLSPGKTTACSHWWPYRSPAVQLSLNLFIQLQWISKAHQKILATHWSCSTFTQNGQKSIGQPQPPLKLSKNTWITSYLHMAKLYSFWQWSAISISSFCRLSNTSKVLYPTTFDAKMFYIYCH